MIATLQNALSDLYAQRKELEEAISSLESLTKGGGGSRGRGRPKKVRAAALDDSKRSTAGWTPEKRKAAAERMRKYWASRRGKPGKKAGGRKRGSKKAARG